MRVSQINIVHLINYPLDYALSSINEMVYYAGILDYYIIISGAMKPIVVTTIV